MANLDTEKLADEVIDRPTVTADEGQDVKQLDAAPADPSPAKSADDPEKEKLRKDKARLERALAKRQEEIDSLKAVKPEEPEAVEPDQNDPLATREGWLSEIDARTQRAMAPLLESNFRKARDRFISAHPEYRTPEKKEELTSILNAAKASGKADEEEIFEVLGSSWAAANWKQLQDAEAKSAARRKTVQHAATSTTAPSDSHNGEGDDFSEEEREEAAKFGKTPAQYRAAAALLKSVSH